VEHVSGTTLLQAPPARVVTLTNTYELDAVLALARAGAPGPGGAAGAAGGGAEPDGRRNLRIAGQALIFQRAGFRISPALAALATAEAPLATVSAEQSRLFDDAALIVLLKYQPAAADAWLATSVAQTLAAV
jgi:ABC-type Fe3+-hydroxamate transport system substrate-binding protein